MISQEFAQKTGLYVDKLVDAQVIMPDDESNCIVWTRKVRVRIQAYQCLLALYVTHLVDHIDAVLGKPWLLQHSAYLDYQNR